MMNNKTIRKEMDNTMRGERSDQKKKNESQ
jgi:hypothetical protein